MKNSSLTNILLFFSNHGKISLMRSLDRHQDQSLTDFQPNDGYQSLIDLKAVFVDSVKFIRERRVI